MKWLLGGRRHLLTFRCAAQIWPEKVASELKDEELGKQRHAQYHFHLMNTQEKPPPTEN